jgi:hypothetical protein
MKVAFITATLFSFLFAFVAALPGGQNAQRMARGLAPLPPVRRQPTPAPVGMYHLNPYRAVEANGTAHSGGA